MPLISLDDFLIGVFHSVVLCLFNVRRSDVKEAKQVSSG